LKVDKVGGLVLGFIRDEEFRTGSMQLNPGDTLVLYTDGVTEAMNVKHELFGADAIEKTLSLTGQTAASQTIIQGLLEGMRVFVGEAEQHDDIAILAIRYLGPSNN
jgi:sigma-B regulation protein RsbU (phosphoserine phosphatase)